MTGVVNMLPVALLRKARNEEPLATFSIHQRKQAMIAKGLIQGSQVETSTSIIIRSAS
jgi:hypothetical protein